MQVREQPGAEVAEVGRVGVWEWRDRLSGKRGEDCWHRHQDVFWLHSGRLRVPFSGNSARILSSPRKMSRKAASSIARGIEERRTVSIL